MLSAAAARLAAEAGREASRAAASAKGSDDAAVQAEAVSQQRRSRALRREVAKATAAARKDLSSQNEQSQQGPADSEEEHGLEPLLIELESIDDELDIEEGGKVVQEPRLAPATTVNIPQLLEVIEAYDNAIVRRLL